MWGVGIVQEGRKLKGDDDMSWSMTEQSVRVQCAKIVESFKFPESTSTTQQIMNQIFDEIARAVRTRELDSYDK